MRENSYKQKSRMAVVLDRVETLYPFSVLIDNYKVYKRHKLLTTYKLSSITTTGFSSIPGGPV